MRRPYNPRYKPIVGQWFKDSQGQLFSLVAVDEEEGTVEVQYYEGEVEEFDHDTWYQLELQPAAQPEDWTGTFDDLIADDLGDTETPRRPEDWNGPWDEIERET